jgi:N-acetyl-beta-hexosaminidase
MAELKRFVREELGRQPISWTIPENTQGRFPLEFPTDDLMQSWNDLREPVFWAQRGHRVIYSLHYSLYLDYPRNYSETHLTWMFHVGDEQIYLCEPCGVWPELVKDSIIGTEACLWTETVPEWRVMPKLLPRLPAYAECCWSRPERKEWHDFARRKEMLEAAGYYEYLRQEASC